MMVPKVLAEGRGDFARWDRIKKMDTSEDRFAGVSLGLGFVLEKFILDYPLSSFGEVGALNRLTLSGMF